MKIAAGLRAALLSALIVSISSAAAAQPLSSPWANADIGNPAIAGRATESGGIFTVVGAGADIWGATDQFHFVFQPVTGDVEIIARVVSISSIHRWSKAGVMIRESLAADSRHAMMAASVSQGYAFQRRLETAGLSANTGGPLQSAPGWVRLVRLGDLFKAYQSQDGGTWQLIGSETVPMGETVYAGLAVTSHNVLNAVTARLDGVRITPLTPTANNPPAVSIITPPSRARYSAPASIRIDATATDPEGALLSVDFYADQTLLDRDTTAPYSTTWAIGTPGTYALTAVAHDADGASTMSAAVDVTVDGVVSPTVTLTNPADGATFFAPATIPLLATAVDPDGQIARVEFYSGVTRLGTDNTVPYSYSWTNVPPGKYSVTAVAFDNSGASTTSAVSTITVASSAPLPAGQQSVDIGRPAVSGSGGYLDGVYTIRGGGVDVWGTSDQCQFVYQQANGDVEIIARVAGLANTYAWAKAGVMIRESLDAGSRNAFALLTPARGYTFQRRAQIGGITVHTPGSEGVAPGWLRLVRAGNLFQAYESLDGATWTLIGSDTLEMATTVYVGLAVTSHSSTVATTAIVDGLRIAELTGNQQPGVVLTAPGSGATFTAPATISLTADATDPENQVARVEFYSGTTLLGADTATPYTWTWDNVAAGTYTLTAKAYDASDGTATSAEVTVTVEQPNAPPTVSLTSPTAGATFTAPAPIDLAAAAADPENQLSRVEFYSGTTLLGSDTSAPYGWTWTNVAAGSYTLMAKAYDAAGATATSATVTVTVNAPNAPPAVTLTSPAGDATFTAPGTINLAAAASDPENQLARVEFLSGTTVLATATTAPYAFTWSNVPAGTYTLTARAFDAAGMQATSAAVTVTVNAPNGAPTVTLTSPASGATFTAPAIINLTATAADPENQVARVEFYSGTTLLGTDTAAPYAWTWTNVAAGNYALTAKAYDAAGAVATSGTATIVVSIAVPPPRLVVFVASADHATNVTSYLLEVFVPGADPATATALVSADLGKPAPDVNDEITSDQATLLTALPPGNYVATVTAIGPGGRTRSGAVTFSR